ncbi:hypothetical protein ATANTOWER_018487 [Ataeniobius toweri]|uniref:Uncharacterized protein n=1 Tax=Ataeniobius toweri TaxID=208326 RepID=A0ABU7B0E8_9TELE|nr:hypothetical protein [Ataeniobius toweri]
MQSTKLLVKTCIGDLVERCGFYPLNGDKLALAKSIIATFPSMSDQVAGQGEGFVTMKSGMEKTFTQSRAWITRESPTLAEILSEYLRFLDMPSLADLFLH